MNVHLGLDFDNTLISYGELFKRVALEKGLIPSDISPEKNQIRDFLRLKEIECEWTKLQGEVYGSRILEAKPFPMVCKVLEFLSYREVGMSIVSHKTIKPYAGGDYDLRSAARSWLKKYGFYDLSQFAFRENQIFFEDSKQSKVEKIINLGCTHYVDDLPEILEMLPSPIVKILFLPEDVEYAGKFQRLKKWDDLPKILGIE